MSHEIFGNRILSREVLPWHELGTVFSGKMTATKAVKTAGLDYEVNLRPLMVDLDGLQVEVPGRMAIVREPTPDDEQYRVFGEVSSDYGITDNLWLAGQLDKLTKTWPVETAGALKLGKTFFLTLDAGSGQVAGEDIRHYFLVQDIKDGKNSLVIAYTPVRVVCQNTLSAALRAATITAAISHKKGVHKEFEIRTNLLAEMQKAQTEVMGAFEAMASVVLSDADIANVVEAIYPYPSRPDKLNLLETLRESENSEEYSGLIGKYERVETAWEAEFDRMDNFRAATMEVLERMNSQDNPKLANSAWYVYNAAVEVEDYRKGPEATTAASILFGSRARTKRKAFNEVYALVPR